MEVTVEVYSLKCIDLPVYTTAVDTELETGTSRPFKTSKKKKFQPTPSLTLRAVCLLVATGKIFFILCTVFIYGVVDRRFQMKILFVLSIVST